MVVNSDYYESRCSKCPPSALIHACSLFLNARTAFLMGSCGKSLQIAWRTIYQFCIICRLRYVGLIFLKHCPPDMKVKRVEIWRIGWPFIFLDKIAVSLGNPFLTHPVYIYNIYI